MIDLSQYDTSYDLQLIKLMIEILKPYILFKKPSDIFQEKDIQIYQIIEGKKEGKILTIKEYIHFIQIKFPNIIQEEIETILQHNKIESVKKEIFESRISNGEFKLPLFLETIDKNLYEFFIEEFNQKSQEELSALKEYYRGLNYKENRELRDDKHNYFQKIQELNRMVNGKVQSVIQFIDNLKYYL